MANTKVKPEFKRNANCITLPQWVWDWLGAQNQSTGRLIEAALIEKYKLHPPNQSKENEQG